MAGERFDNINSETFLFGENNDLNYLSNKPVPVSIVLLLVVFYNIHFNATNIRKSAFLRINVCLVNTAFLGYFT